MIRQPCWNPSEHDCGGRSTFQHTPMEMAGTRERLAAGKSLAEIPALWRATFRLSMFRTKTRRIGKVLWVTPQTISYYTYRARYIRVLPR
jgi:hypothetical protein